MSLDTSPPPPSLSLSSMSREKHAGKFPIFFFFNEITAKEALLVFNGNDDDEDWTRGERICEKEKIVRARSFFLNDCKKFYFLTQKKRCLTSF